MMTDFDIQTVNPVGYDYTPLADNELAAWWDVPSDKKAWWNKKARKLNVYARDRGAVGTIGGQKLWGIYNRYQTRCAYCGQPGADSWDHVVPLWKKGTNTADNLLPVHVDCNQKMNDWDQDNLPLLPRSSAIEGPDGTYISCFGFVNGTLYFGQRHHMAIMNWLLDHGFDWNTLMTASQIWGWVYPGSAGTVYVRFSTDAGILDTSLESEAAKAIEQYTGKPVMSETIGQSNSEFAPNFERLYGEGGDLADFEPIKMKVFHPTPPNHEDEQLGLPGIESSRKFVYDTHTKKINVAVNNDDWKEIHHWDLLEQHGLDEDQVIRHLEHGTNRFIFGEQENEYPHLYTGPEVSDQHKQNALDAYEKWLIDNGIVATAAYSSDERNALTNQNRVVWLIDRFGHIKISEIGSEDHHVDLGMTGSEIAMGDILGTKSGVWLRVLQYNPNETDIPAIKEGVDRAWDVMYPSLPITKVLNYSKVDLTDYQEYDKLAGSEPSWMPAGLHSIPTTQKKKKEQQLAIGPAIQQTHDDLNGYRVYQMESGEYPDHDAILIDRDHKQLLMNYQGHHEPMMRQMSENGIPWPDSNFTTGHYRTAPSRTEHFTEGFGWHGDEGSSDETEAIKQILREHYGVDDLRQLWEKNAGLMSWVKIGKKNELTWKGLFDTQQKSLFLWTPTPGDTHESMMFSIYPGVGNDQERFILAAGEYHKISYITAHGQEIGEAVALIEQALTERWPEAT